MNILLIFLNFNKNLLRSNIITLFAGIFNNKNQARTLEQSIKIVGDRNGAAPVIM